MAAVALKEKDKVRLASPVAIHSINDTSHYSCPSQGNAAFKTGDFPTAIGHYTAAFIADPSNPTYPLNRAAAYLKLGKCVFVSLPRPRILFTPWSRTEMKTRNGIATQY